MILLLKYWTCINESIYQLSKVSCFLVFAGKYVAPLPPLPENLHLVQQASAPAELSVAEERRIYS